MFRRLLLLLSVLTFWAAGTIMTRGQALLELPYGLKWGDSPEKLISWASKHSLDVMISLPGKQPALRVVRVDGGGAPLPGTTESVLEGQFLNGRLIELTLHYTAPTVTANEMEERFVKLKSEVAIRHGSLVTDLEKKEVRDQFVTVGKSFHREPVKGLYLVLAFTEVEDLLRKSKEARYSLMYRNDNLRQDIEKMLAAPAPVPKDGK